jgi:hypothetical protein
MGAELKVAARYPSGGGATGAGRHRDQAGQFSSPPRWGALIWIKVSPHLRATFWGVSSVLALTARPRAWRRSCPDRMAHQERPTAETQTSVRRPPPDRSGPARAAASGSRKGSPPPSASSPIRPGQCESPLPDRGAVSSGGPTAGWPLALHDRRACDRPRTAAGRSAGPAPADAHPEPPGPDPLRQRLRKSARNQRRRTIGKAWQNGAASRAWQGTNPKSGPAASCHGRAVFALIRIKVPANERTAIATAAPENA